MSTFKGIVAEFPHIRIDYFRLQPDHRAPLACFLSHVHSDHLTGLESLGAPFVYCSAATREILLRLEKFHYRLNFARGILESRNVTYHRSMRKLAKPLPLDTPTVIELSPGNTIRVTLIDANHCVGAVMFLIEDDSRAILYTGDIRAETWWVNSLVQHPILLPYTLGSRRLDCMYLDTTFATKSKPYRDFPSKAEGIRELLAKVGAYPDATIFYFHSWTFGYESVWMALSNFLQSRIHVDDYRARIYASLSTLDKKSLRQAGLHVQSDNKDLRESGLEIREAPPLCGFKNGNRIQPGCLTSRSDVRIHSCERGMGCPVVEHDTDAHVVHIVPIITRSDGLDIAELGAGGGKGDLDQKEELETGDAVDVGKLMELCAKSIKDPVLLSKVLSLVQQGLHNDNGTIDLDMNLQRESQDSEANTSLQTLVSVLSSHASRSQEPPTPPGRSIHFPYSRHSSYYELCALLDAFRPRDVFPCTVDEANWDPALSMRFLFEPFCSEGVFRHDADMTKIYEARLEREAGGRVGGSQEEDGGNGESQDGRDGESQEDGRDGESQELDGKDGKFGESNGKRNRGPQDASSGIGHTTRIETKRSKLDRSKTPSIEQSNAFAESFTPAEDRNEVQSAAHTATHVQYSHTSPPQSPTIPNDPSLVPGPITILPSSYMPLVPSPTTKSFAKHKRQKSRLSNKQLAYEAALGTRLTWADYGGLVSTKSNALSEEEVL